MRKLLALIALIVSTSIPIPSLASDAYIYPPGTNAPVQHWLYPSLATMNSDAGFRSQDIYKTAYNQQDGNYYYLYSINPTVWKLISSGVPAPTATPGGANQQGQYNNAGGFGGIQYFNYNGTAVTQTAGTSLSAHYFLVDPTDTTKKVDFGLSAITTGTTRDVLVPNANSNTVVPSTGGTGQFVNGIGSNGVLSYGTPATGGAYPAGGVDSVQFNAGSSTFGGITNVTTDGNDMIFSTGSPVGIMFYKRVSGVSKTVTGPTLVYNVPSGKTCLAQGFFQLTTDHTGTATTHSTVRIDCYTSGSSVGVMVPQLANSTTSDTLNDVAYNPATSGAALVPCPGGSAVEIVMTVASNYTTEHADYTAVLLIY